MRKSFAVIGGQDGDEGKGKVIDYLVSQAAARTQLSPSAISSVGKPILVRRYQGGANAGHTVGANNKEYKLNQVPSGIITPNTFNLLGKRMYVNPRELTNEIRRLQEQGISATPENLGIAANAHVTLAYHLAEDATSFNLRKHTSTGNGIRQTATDKYNRVGIRLIEFLDRELMKEIIKEKRFPGGLPANFGSLDEFVDSYAAERNFLTPFVVQEHAVLKQHGQLYLFDEGAQGFGIDIDDGFYPGITSSNPVLAPREASAVVAVFKFYKSSVGTGDRPFVTQIPTELETVLRNLWGERGTRTGRDRDLGYFDIPAARYALEATGADYLAGTCGDRMEAFAKVGAKPKIAIAYDVGGRIYDEWDASFFRRDTLYKAVPIYEEFEPWEKFVEEDGKTLTSNASKYVHRIEELLGKRFSVLGTGPKRSDMIAYDQLV